MRRSSLELGAERDLTGTRAAEVGANRAGDQHEAGRTQVHVGVAQVGVVEHVGEGAFRLHLDSIGNQEGLAQAGGEVEEAGTFDGTDLAVAEAADGPIELEMSPKLGELRFML